MTRSTTTDRSRRLPRRAQFSVRTRLTVALSVLTASALTAAGVLVWVLESARIDREVDERIDQEIAEFRQLDEGKDPDTARPFDDVTRLLEVFFQRNVADRDELLLGYDETAAGPLSTDDEDSPRLGIRDDPGFQEAMTDLDSDGGTRKLETAAFGEVWVTVVPVRNNRTDGSLVLVNFVDDARSELNRTMRTYALVALLMLGLIAFLAAWQSSRLLAPLRTLRLTAGEITATDLSRRIPEIGRDDITALTRTINDMLERLEAGFAAQRDFLDDAGHELRTPLTVLRGHLELLRQGDPDDVAETQALLLDEVDRMSRLVDDLLLLAKSRRPDFVRPAPVDLAVLTGSLAAKSRALGEREWSVDEAAATTVRLDEQRVTQAVLQLADNAVKHTSPGERIALGSSWDGHDVRIWVRDTGDGVAETDRERIFERFGRAGVRPGDEGFGLGLSLVRAIAEAHGGRVQVYAEAPRGSRFVITIPTEDRAWHAS